MKAKLTVIGVNIRYSLMSCKNSSKNVGIYEYSEGEFKNGKYTRDRMLNGDERFTLV
ncbi:DUF5597 domain-containing protein [Streptococcus castoreus]|uniref:DUF5597 domain-containing protein n=1 Tax=Streptococcus castoreus TaxID=254786 RepID=UPI003CC6AB6C